MEVSEKNVGGRAEGRGKESGLKWERGGRGRKKGERMTVQSGLGSLKD